MSTAARCRSLVSRVIVLPSVRWTRRRRSRIGSVESPLLAKRTSLSWSTVKSSPCASAMGRSPTMSRRILVLGSGEEDRALVGDRGPPAIMAIALVKDIGGTRLDRDRAADLGVVDVGIGDVEDARAVGLRVKDDMHLQAADAPVRFGPVAQLAERDGRRIDQLHHGRAVMARLPIELACDQAEGLGEER